MCHAVSIFNIKIDNKCFNVLKWKRNLGIINTCLPVIQRFAAPTIEKNNITSF